MNNGTTRANSTSYRERAHAKVKLPWFSEPEATKVVSNGLQDRHQDVRKASVKAMIGIDNIEGDIALQGALSGAEPKLAAWIRRVLDHKSHISTLREGIV